MKHSITFESKLFGQPNGMTASISEQLGKPNFGHRRLPSENIPQIYIVGRLIISGIARDPKVISEFFTHVARWSRA